MTTEDYNGFMATILAQWPNATNMTVDEMVVWRQKLSRYTEGQSRAGLQRYLAGPEAKWRPTIRKLTDAIIQERMREPSRRVVEDESDVSEGRQRMLEAVREAKEMLK